MPKRREGKYKMEMPNVDKQYEIYKNILKLNKEHDLTLITEYVNSLDEYDVRVILSMIIYRYTFKRYVEQRFMRKDGKYG